MRKLLSEMGLAVESVRLCAPAWLARRIESTAVPSTECDQRIRTGITVPTNAGERCMSSQGRNASRWIAVRAFVGDFARVQVPCSWYRVRQCVGNSTTTLHERQLIELRIHHLVR